MECTTAHKLSLAYTMGALAPSWEETLRAHLVTCQDCRGLAEGIAPEQPAERAEDRFRLLVENSRDIIYTLTPDGVFTYVSPGWTSLLGHPVESVVGQPFHPFVHPDDVDRCMVHMRRVLETGGAGAAVEYRVRHAVGSWRYHRSTGRVLRDDSGQVIGFQGTAQDITDRRQTEEALRESERRFMDVLYASDDAILLIGANNFIDCNEATARMLGYPARKEFLQTHPSELSPPVQPDGRSSFEKAEEMMRIAFEQGYHRFEWEHRKANGESLPVEVSLTPIVHNGQPLLHCVWRDLSEQRRMQAQQQQAEAEARDANARARALMDTARVGIVLMRADDRTIVEANPEAARMIGTTVDNLIGSVYTHLCPHEPGQCPVFDLHRPTHEAEGGIRLANGGTLPVLRTYRRLTFGGQDFILKTFMDVTELQAARRQAIESAEHLSATLRSIGDGVVTCDRKGRVTSLNRAAETLTGYTSGEAATRPLDEVLRVIDARTREAAANPAARALAEGVNVHLADHTTLISRDGTEYQIAQSCAPIRDASGAVTGAVLVFHDVTEETRRREELRQERERLEHVLSATGTGIDIIDADYNLQFVNKGWQQVYGDPTGRKCHEYFNGLSEPCQGCGIPRALETKQVVVTEEVLPREGNRPIEVRIIPFQDSTGQWLVAEINIDITQRKQAEEALARLAEEQRILLDNIQTQVWYLTDEHTYGAVNDAHAAFVGLPTEDIAYRSLYDIFPAQSVDDCLPTNAEVFATGKPVTVERWAPCGTGELRLLSISKSPHLRPDGSVEYVVCSAEDITERSRAEESLKSAEMELRQAQKLQAVGQLAAGVAHEINTPAQFIGDSLHFLSQAFTDGRAMVAQYREVLATFQGAPGYEEAIRRLEGAEAVADSAYVEEHAPAALERALDGISRISTIVQAMKEFAHTDQREKSPADLNRAIETTLTIARNEIKYAAEVETDFGDLPPVECHLGEVNQVLLNLLVNAAHAIADVVGDSGDRGRIGILTRHEGDNVRIEVSDTGCGIPEEVQPRIFEPFFTTKEVGRGSGQGLAIARSVVVDKHGGTLTFRTEPGKGTTFVVTLPVGGEIQESGHEALGSDVADALPPIGELLGSGVWQDETSAFRRR